MIDLELVVDEQHAFVGNERRHEARNGHVAQDVDVVTHLD
jgi:hypothetical protein